MSTQTRKALVIGFVAGAVAAALVVCVAAPASRSAQAGTRTAEASVDGALADLDASDTFRRVRAIRLLGATRDVRASDALRRLLDDRDPAVRREAAVALASLTNDAAALRVLTAGAAERPDFVAALGTVPGTATDDALAALARPRSPLVRGGALKALARREPAKAAPLVVDALRSDDPTLRFLALEAALLVDDPSAVRALRGLALSEDAVERRLALALLTRTGEPGSLDALVADADKAHAAGDLWGELVAAEALASVGFGEGARLWSRAADAMDDTDRTSALCRLRAGVPEKLRPAVRSLLTDRSRDVRVAAALALVASGDAAAADVLRRDGPSSDRATAADCDVALAALAAR